MSNTDRPRAFYLVWNVGGGSPTVLHESYQMARTEAQRLARVHRGNTFAVLESLSAHQVSDMIDTAYETSRDIPF